MTASTFKRRQITLEPQFDLGFQGDGHFGFTDFPRLHHSNDSTIPPTSSALTKTLARRSCPPNQTQRMSTPIIIRPQGNRPQWRIRGQGLQRRHRKGTVVLQKLQRPAQPLLRNGLVYTVNGKPRTSTSSNLVARRRDQDPHGLARQTQRRRDLPSSVVIGDQVLVTAMSGTTCSYNAKSGDLNQPTASRSFSPPSSQTGSTTSKMKPAPPTSFNPQGTPGRLQKLHPQPKAKSSATLAPIDGKVYIRSSTTLYCVQGS